MRKLPPDESRKRRYQRSRAWALLHPERTLEYSRKWRAKNLDKARKAAKENKTRRRAIDKVDCLEAYGGKCVCCGESEFKFLTIDHIDGQGARHRRKLKQQAAYTGTCFYLWLRARGYPKDNYRILCFNCNCGRQLNYGICPHEELNAASR